MPHNSHPSNRRGIDPPKQKAPALKTGAFSLRCYYTKRINRYIYTYMPAE